MTTPAIMQEATRLTREGRLQEAMALLKGGPVPVPQDATVGDTYGATIDLAPPPPGSGGAWTAQGAPAGAAMPPALKGFMERMAQGGLPGGLQAGPMGARPAATIPPGATWEERLFAGDGGSRPYKVYVPAAHAGPLPLVVMLHGCTQSPDDFAAGTRMNELAEELGFVVAYPGQTQAANAQRCWNWFSEADQRRGAGEPAIVAGIARAVMAAHPVDPARVYVAGLSAGGAAAAIVGAAYPDVFAAVGVHSGLACGAARDMPGAFAAMRGSAGAVDRHGKPVPTIVFHGDRDATVAPVNGDEVAAQARGPARARAETSTGRSPGGMTFARTVHRDAKGRALTEHWVLHGAGHAWSGGSAAGSYTDPRGPDASREMLRFFAEQAPR